MKKISLLLLITILINIIPCVSFADSNLPTNTKLAEWVISGYTNSDQIANSVNPDNSLVDINRPYGSDILDVNDFSYSNKKYLKPCDGLYARYDVNDAGSLATSMNDGFSLEVWFRPGDGDWYTYPSIFTITDENDNVKFTIQIPPNNYDRPECVKLIRTGENSESFTAKGCMIGSDDEIYFDKWYHMVVIVGSNTTRTVGDMKLFINGKEMALTTEGSSNATPIEFEATDKMFLHGPDAWVMNSALISDTSIYSGKMTEANAKALYDASKSDYTMAYDVVVKKSGILVPKSNLLSIVEGNITVEATITTSADRAESNVYVLNKATNQKVAFTRTVSGNLVTLTAPENHLVAGEYQFVIENKDQRLDFTVTEDVAGRLTAVNAVNAAIANPGTDYANIKTAIFSTYKKFFQISDEVGSDYASVLNKNGIFEVFTQTTNYASVNDIITAFNSAIEAQKLRDFSDAVVELKNAMSNNNMTEFKNVLLTTYQPVFSLPVGVGSVYASLGTSKEAVFTQLIETNIANLSDVEVVATIKTKFDEICAEQRFTLDYNAFYAEINNVSAANMESKLKNNTDKTGIDLVETNTELWNDYQANKSAVNTALAAADISTKTKLRNEFYSALTLAILNGAGNDRTVTKRALANYATNIDGVDANLAANIDAVAIELTGRTFTDINDLIQQTSDAVANADGNDGTIGGVTPKDGGYSALNRNTFGYVVNSNQPGFTVPDKDKVDQKPAEVKGFTDLAGYDWAAEYINKLYDLGVVNGKAANTFAPADKVTRYEYVAMLTRAFNLEGEAELPFADVEADHWAYAAVKAAYSLGIVGGVDAFTFDGNASITREAMATIVYRYLGVDAAENVAEYADNAEISDWAYDAVYKMQELGLMNGKDGNTFDPKGLATRAETATLICRLMESYAE